MTEHDRFTDQERVKQEHIRIYKNTLQVKQKELDTQNVKLAFHIHKQSASIDVKKQLTDFEKHQNLLKLHGKYKNNKVWGGVPGSATYRGSPKKY